MKTLWVMILFLLTFIEAPGKSACRFDTDWRHQPPKHHLQFSQGGSRVLLLNTAEIPQPAPQSVFTASFVPQLAPTQDVNMMPPQQASEALPQFSEASPQRLLQPQQRNAPESEPPYISMPQQLEIRMRLHSQPLSSALLDTLSLLATSKRDTCSNDGE